MRFNKAYTKWSEQDILDRMKEICDNDHKFPTRSRLDELREFRLINAIGFLHLSYNDIAIKLGYTPTRKSRGYWNEETILQELQKIIDANEGVYPTSKFIAKERGEILRAIFRTRDWRYYKEKLGFEVKEQWSKTKILDQIQNHITSLGYTPATTELKKIDSSLLGAIDKSPNTYGELLIELGYPPLQNAKGFWKEWENVKNSILPHCINGKMPSVSSLKDILGSTVGSAIADFGGVADVAERLEVQVSPESYLKSKDGHYLQSNYEVQFDDFLFDNNVHHEIHCQIKPKCAMKCDFKIQDVFVEIWGFNERPNNKRCVNYAQKRKKKEEIYRSNNLKLVSIEGSVFKKSKLARNIIFKETLDIIQSLRLTLS